jgi:hypothetical protein
MSNTLFRSTTTRNSTRTFVFPTWQYHTINLVRRCPMYKVTGFVGHNERISTKCNKRGASFVINSCCSYTIIQFVNIQQDYSTSHRQFPNNSLLSLSTICHEAWRWWYVNLSSKKPYIYILWHTLCSILLLSHLQQHCNHCCRPQVSKTIFFQLMFSLSSG